MGRLSRFEEHRFVGTRDNMAVYDCDDPDQLLELEQRVKRDDLLRRGLLQGFGPDEPLEAANRGFRSAG
ncbi:hypothetical protein BH23ACT5_BH23ACT5_14820 [soil metagenome]